MKNERGFTLTEVLVAITVLAIVLLSIASGFSFSARQNVRIREKNFATQKAIQMMEEMRGLISNTDNSTIGILDNYSDGTGYNYVLTTNMNVTNPADPTSGNAGLVFKR